MVRVLIEIYKWKNTTDRGWSQTESTPAKHLHNCYTTLWFKLLLTVNMEHDHSSYKYPLPFQQNPSPYSSSAIAGL